MASRHRAEVAAAVDRAGRAEVIWAEASHPIGRVLDEAGHRQALLAKLTEEAQEVMSWLPFLALADDKRRRQDGTFFSACAERTPY